MTAGVRDGSRTPRPRDRRIAAIEGAVRRTPIRWRIGAIAVLNSALAIILLAVIWNGAQVLADAWTDLRRVRESERFLNGLGADADRLQSLIHRYFAQNEPAILERIVDLRETLVSRLRVQARLDPLIAGPARDLTAVTERFVAGFDDLRETRTAISLVYDKKIVDTAKQMSAIYGKVASATADPNSPIWPSLARSREAYNDMILAANSFYLSATRTAAQEALEKAGIIRQTAPIMLDLSADKDQRRSLDDLKELAETFEEGLNDLGVWFATQNRLLREAVDGNAEAMSASIDRLTGDMNKLELSAQMRFDRTVQDVAVKLGILAAAFVALVVLMGIAIARSISEPLGSLRADMTAVMTGQLDRRIVGLRAADEIGEMARAVDVFRTNAVDKRRAEEDLRKAKERAESSLAEVRQMQRSLIEAEKLAALGGLVAGVAHEVNNPVGISLTVASSLAERSDAFAAEIASGQIRRSRLEDFTRATKTAAAQLVANLQRAGELVQSFKQVAVDRSQAERRSFDLAQAIDQILASLRPGLKTLKVRLEVDVPAGIVMTSYPGPFGQVLTNLFLNALNHAFTGAGEGTISIEARRTEFDQVRITFRDNGCGMSEEVQRRAFDPFFTTRRGEGGTGLGLHIVYNIVTQRLGGRITLSSSEDRGTTFTLVLPLLSPGEEPVAAPGPAARLATTEALHG